MPGSSSHLSSASRAATGMDPVSCWPAVSILQFEDRAQQRDDEVQDLFAFLIEHANPGLPADVTSELALIIARASLGDRHLWEDLGLASRAELANLMNHHFPRLVELNAQGMRWKKFLYRQLCIRHDILICRSPSCSTCDEQHRCFAPESPGSA